MRSIKLTLNLICLIDSDISSWIHLMSQWFSSFDVVQTTHTSTTDSISIQAMVKDNALLEISVPYLQLGNMIFKVSNCPSKLLQNIQATDFV